MVLTSYEDDMRPGRTAGMEKAPWIQEAFGQVEFTFVKYP